MSVTSTLSMMMMMMMMSTVMILCRVVVGLTIEDFLWSGFVSVKAVYIYARRWICSFFFVFFFSFCFLLGPGLCEGGRRSGARYDKDQRASSLMVADWKIVEWKNVKRLDVEHCGVKSTHDRFLVAIFNWSRLLRR